MYKYVNQNAIELTSKGASTVKPPKTFLEKLNKLGLFRGGILKTASVMYGVNYEQNYLSVSNISVNIYNSARSVFFFHVCYRFYLFLL
jgi:hypothetical protein